MRKWVTSWQEDRIRRSHQEYFSRIVDNM